MSNNIVIVESPAKAKTINKYLGSDYEVLASFGHIRDLSPKDGSVRPEEDFAMEWEIDSKAEKHLKAIAAACRSAKNLYLATDPDREGEAISWHVREVLDQRKALKGVDVKRVVFNEITKSAILEAFRQPRELDADLINAYLARRALDYLVGFTLSPVLWRKLPGARSAGRVQSVALRLICERENEIERFISREYWTVKGQFLNAAGQALSAMLTHLDGRKLDKLDLGSQEAADDAVRKVEATAFSVARVERKKSRRNPAPPFTTSTLQQEAARKLHFSASRTMKVAQRLYEGVTIDGETVGLITYMRTDGVQMAGEAVSACRRLIGERFGETFLPGSPRIFKTRAKNAQEAHEAIRPTDVRRTPEQAARHLNDEQKRLYSLIWQRTVASQMESAVLDQVAADLSSPDGAILFRATGSVIVFDGFLRLYQEGRDDPDRDGGGEAEDSAVLPDLREGEAVERTGVIPEQHFTQPPPRYSEASLVKKLEELGIGRPSTYATILSVLQNRDYVVLDKRRFIPEDRGRIVTAFLTSFFKRYVEYDFTAELEEQLDDVSDGRNDWKRVLSDFWGAFNQAVESTRDLRRKEILEALDSLLDAHFFHTVEAAGDPRACPSCDDGRLSLKLGRYGAFIGCTNYPSCRHTRKLAVPNNGESPEDGLGDNGFRDLGTDPVSGLTITLRRGPYGYYVQVGEAGEGEKPKRASLPKDMEPEGLDLERALALLALPREIGRHPESGEDVTAGIGRYGPYIRHGDVYVSIPKGDDVLTIGINRAVALLADSPAKRSAKTLGSHPADGKPVTLRSGRFGPYVQHGALRATLPRTISSDEVTLEQAIEMLAAKAARGGSKGTRKKTTGRKSGGRARPVSGD